MAETIYDKYADFSAGNGVGFKAGTQANLNDLITNGKAQEGVFYLTTDTQRLYVGRKNTSGKTVPVPVNQGITNVQNIDALPAQGNQGDIYYAQDENILCIRSGGIWVQINSDTNTYVNDITQTSSATNNVGTITTKVIKNDNSSNSDSFTITGDDNTIKVDNNSTNKGLKLTSRSYDLQRGTNAGEIKLAGTLGEDASISSIILAGKDGGKVSVSNSKTVNGQIDIDVAYIDEGSVTLGADGKLTLVLTDTDGKNRVNFTSTSPYTFKYGKEALTQKQAVLGGDLLVYTIDEIDTKIRNLNAMVYKGVLNSKDDIPTYNTTQIGDTYKVNAKSITYTTNPGAEESKQKTAIANQGDLLIATGTEDNNGYITEESLIWTQINSGDDLQDTQFSFKNETTSVTSNSNNKDTGKTILVSSDNKNTGAITIKPKDNSAISILAEKSNEDSEITYTIGHDTITTASNTGTAQTNVKSFDAINSITVDGNGHLTGYTTTNYTNYEKTLKNGGISVTDNAGTFITKLVGGDSAEDADYASQTFSSSTLNLTADTTNNKLSFDLVWGVF